VAAFLRYEVLIVLASWKPLALDERHLSLAGMGTSLVAAYTSTPKG